MALALLLFITFTTLATVGASLIAWNLKGRRAGLLTGAAVLCAFVILGIAVGFLLWAGVSGRL